MYKNTFRIVKYNICQTRNASQSNVIALWHYNFVAFQRYNCIKYPAYRPIQAADRGNAGQLWAAADKKETVCAAWIKRRAYIPFLFWEVQNPAFLAAIRHPWYTVQATTPIQVEEGGVQHGLADFLYTLCCGKRSSLLHLQMDGQKVSW